MMKLYVLNYMERHLSGLSTDNMLELSQIDKKRIFNLGYFTWVEQQGVSLEDFEKRKNQDFWNSHLQLYAFSRQSD